MIKMTPNPSLNTRLVSMQGHIQDVFGMGFSNHGYLFILATIGFHYWLTPKIPPLDMPLLKKAEM